MISHTKTCNDLTRKKVELFGLNSKVLYGTKALQNMIQQ